MWISVWSGLALGDVEKFRHDARHAFNLFEAGVLGTHSSSVEINSISLQAHGQRRQRGMQLVRRIGGRLAFCRQTSGHVHRCEPAPPRPGRFPQCRTFSTRARTPPEPICSAWGSQVDEADRSRDKARWKRRTKRTADNFLVTVGGELLNTQI